MTRLARTVPLAVLATLVLAAAAHAEPVTAVRFSGSSTNRVDVVILGDGYTAAEIASGKYATDIETFVQRVFAQEPYLEYQSYFNVRRVDVTSAESGSDHPELGTAKNTALDGTYNCSGIQRLVCVNLTKVNDVLSRSSLAPTEKDIILVVVNDMTYGGSGGSIAVSSTNAASAEIILHELGHSFGQLADEYGGPPPPACNSAVEPAAVNATRATTRNTIKWNQWIDAGTPIPTQSFVNGVPGLYQGAAYCDADLYRPSFDSKMRSLNRPFEAINTEQHVKRIYNLVDPIDDTAPAGNSVIAPAGQTVGFTVTVPPPRTHVLQITWRLDGAIVGSAPGLVLTGSMLPAGTHQIEVTVRDPTAMVRSDPASLLVSTKAWTLTTIGMTLVPDKTSLRFAAVSNGAAVLSQTGPQSIRLMQSGPGTVSWTATANQPWLTVSPAAGTGPGVLTVAVLPGASVPLGATLTGAVTFAFAGSGNTSGSTAVALTTYPAGASGPPAGVVDTPLDNAAGVVGAIPVTGWAIDDVEVGRVTLCRDAVGAEVPPLDPNCNGAAQIYVADGLFIDGARPDVQAGYPNVPRASEAGWGLMVLTNMLPNGGNGAYAFSIYALDRDGHGTLLGTRRLTAANSAATLPFGTIDTPAAGETIGGTAYVNFGWALTPQPKMIAADGSTMNVYIDGALVGHPIYNNYRADIATLFPGLTNSLGAIGYRILNTTVLADGLHTIAWTATDSLGATEGLGSRYFRVANSTAATAPPATRTARTAATATRPADLDAATVATVPEANETVMVRRGWSPDTPLQPMEGRLLRGEELDRFELHLGGTGRFAGYVRVGAGLSPLPLGSQLDATTGTFLWAPGVGFVGQYHLVFVRWADGRPVSRQEIEVQLRPKGHGHVGPQVVIDTPTAQQIVGEPFALGGWAADLDAASGSGIETLHVWAYPVGGGAPVFVGTAGTGGLRPDVAAIHGDQFKEAGYGLTVQGLAPGTYDLAVFAWSGVRGAFAPAAVVRVTVQ
jgi:hypothetical protein